MTDQQPDLPAPEGAPAPAAPGGPRWWESKWFLLPLAAFIGYLIGNAGAAPAELRDQLAAETSARKEAETAAEQAKQRLIAAEQRVGEAEARAREAEARAREAAAPPPVPPASPTPNPTEADSLARASCRHFRNVMNDIEAGLLNDVEIREKLREVYGTADGSRTPGIAPLAQRMFAAATQDDGEALALHAGAFSAACESSGAWS